MSPDWKVPRPAERGLEVHEMRSVDLRTRGVGDLRGLLVCSFDQANPGRLVDQSFDVTGRPFQIRLDTYSHAVVSFEKLLTDPDRVVRRMGILHVQPKNPTFRFRGIEDGDHLGERVRLVDQHAKLRRLQTDGSSD